MRPALASLLLLAGCATSDPPESGAPGAPVQLPDGALRFEATVRFVNLEGGCWLLEAVGGQRFEPVALPEALRQDGQRVRVTVRDFDGGSICMMGRLVTVDSAEAI